MLEKRFVLPFITACLLFCVSAEVFAAPPVARVFKSAQGITVYPDIRFSGNTRAVRLQVITDKIIRVTASPSADLPETKSLITVYPSLSNNWTSSESGTKVVLKTPSVTASILKTTGAVSFFDNKGTPILMERQYNGRRFSPAVFDGESSYGIHQTFETTPDDAYYGLGQHQDDQFNYKG